MKKHLLILLIIIPCSIWAGDFGLIVDQRVGFGGVTGDNNQFDYTGVLLPRFSTLVGNNGELFISAGLTVDYSSEEWTFIPELLRTEFQWIFAMGDFRVGRMFYSDPLGIIATGLFDGAQITFDTMAGSFSAGAWYTGFLFNDRANIAMTYSERQSLDASLDFDNFADTYFAPSRALFALDWEHRYVAGGFLRAALSLICQFDLTDEDVNTQYLALRLTYPLGALLFNLGGSLGFAQVSGDNQTFLAAQAGLEWTLPTSFASRFSLLGRMASGITNDESIHAFLPVTTISLSPVLQSGVSGLTMIHLDYSARFNRQFALSLSSYYFIRNDLYTDDSFVSIAGNDGFFLGNEFFARLFWIPASDVQLNLGAGLFLPSMGNVAPDVGNAWRIEFGLSVSLF